MDGCDRLETEIEALQQQLTSLEQQEPFLTGVRVERTAAGGTASPKSKTECKYARLRAGKGKLLDNGKKSKYIACMKLIDTRQCATEERLFLGSLGRFRSERRSWPR